MQKPLLSMVHVATHTLSWQKVLPLLHRAEAQAPEGGKQTQFIPVNREPAASASSLCLLKLLNQPRKTGKAGQ